MKQNKPKKEKERKRKRRRDGYEDKMKNSS
jgi:hypothetical protein